MIVMLNSSILRKEIITAFMTGGGFIFSAVHNIQDGIPPENIMAMFETFEEFRKH